MKLGLLDKTTILEQQTKQPHTDLTYLKISKRELFIA